MPSFPNSLDWAHPLVAEWFVQRFGTPTEPQEQGWPHILAGRTTLISAPTGSGKTLAAFLACIDRLVRKALAGDLSDRTEVLYVSPLKALGNDIQKNLEVPLGEILAMAGERGLLMPEIRTAVRTGDTLMHERRAMLKRPPHILVTTPESLYILLTADKSRAILRDVETVIVDEIHAVADDKRGAHLTLSLERLSALTYKAPVRIGLSATQKPIEEVAHFLTGSSNPNQSRTDTVIVNIGHKRKLDLAVEVPTMPLGPVSSNEMWDEVYNRLVALVEQHRSTLVFVNTRRMAERIAHNLGERIGEENVAAHHGSLSRKLRLTAEKKLKEGQVRVLVATASLELGIDIGTVDLVVQINSPRAIAVTLQRVGRSGHWRGAVPKGRLFCTTRDDLLECAALVRAIRHGDLDRLMIPESPLDVLAQQMVAACSAEEWSEDDMFALVRRAYPYRNLTRERFDEVLALLHSGIEASRGRYGAYLLRDGVQHRLHPRRGARMIAIANGGSIPDSALFNVILQPEGLQIATLDEHFAVDSSPGDVILLGNTSWRVQRIEAAGRVLVEDAHGAPPNVPFWFGEAPQRTAVLSDSVGTLREQISALTLQVSPGFTSAAQPEVATAVAWLMESCGVCAAGALQLVTYIVTGRAVLGAVPSKTTIIAERFFDEGGGMQLILHAPFGGRINKAWGLALRKRFCRGFNFELQAAATDNGINISLAEQHSFPLSDVFQFLTEHTAKELLEQAAIASPIFKTRWRWAAGRSLQLLRMSKGKRIAPQVQRTRSEDLLASVFPQAAACFETIVGDIQIPAHPLVDEVMKDVLQEAMDLEGLIGVLRGIASGEIRCLAVDTPVPSQFAHELLNANPYAFLDDAGLEERRARAVDLGSRTGSGVPASVLEGAGRVDPAAIATVRGELWPDLRDEHELHDLLQSLVVLPLRLLEREGTRHWPAFYERLTRTGRAHVVECGGQMCWVAAERLEHLERLKHAGALVLEGAEQEAALKIAVQGWVQLLGPTTARGLAEWIGVDAGGVYKAFLAMEMQGLLMRGAFERVATEVQYEMEWCERRILERIHRLTRSTLRKQIEAVAPAVYMRWLLGWQHLAPQTQLAGEEGVFRALEQLEGFEAPAIEWERSLLPARVAGYDSRWLDQLCLSGAVGWGRISPHPAWGTGDGGVPRRVIPTNAAPITFYVRETAEWLPQALAENCVDETKLAAGLSIHALRVRSLLEERGACFANDLQRFAGLTRAETQHALWELATAGLAAADGFDPLRAMMDPRRRSMTADGVEKRKGRNTGRNTAGRWSLLCEETQAALTGIEAARQRDAALESAARVLLARYGVVFRDLLARESNAPKWRDLLGILRRLEARGEVRGGRFVSGFGGEQFALPEAVESLRTARERESQDVIAVAAADPLNLAGIVVPGERVASVPGRWVEYRNGVVVCEAPLDQAQPEISPRGRRALAEVPLPPLPREPEVPRLTLFL